MNVLERAGLAEMLNDASIDRVMAVDTELKIIAWNKASETITGLPRSLVTGRLLPDVFPWFEEDEAVRKAFGVALKGYKSYLPADANLEHRSFYENHFIPLTDANGNVQGAMNIMHDVSHRIKAELALSQLNARLEAKYNELQRALSEIASYTFITSNNIKTPLRQIYTSLEKIIRTEGAALSNGSKASFRRMQTSISRMNLLLDDILSISSINSFRQTKQEVNLNEILARVKEGLSEKIAENKMEIIADALPIFHSYPEMLLQLFYHIVDNAIKFQARERLPILKISHSFETIKDPSGQNREYLKISFSDNGIGFGSEDGEKIVQLLEKDSDTGQFDSWGRGLAVCKKVAELHEGFITAVSLPGTGATFSVFLPTITSDDEQERDASLK